MIRSAVVLLLLVLTGCSWLSDDKGIFVDKSDDYLKATENKSLVIPGNLNAERVQDPNPIPDITDRLRPEYFPKQPPRPDTIYATDNRDEVRIQSLGDRRWLVIPEAPTTVWPKVKQFLAENGVGVAWESPSAGRLDTQWLQVDAGHSYRDVIRQLISEGKLKAGLDGGVDRLRIRVEPGLRERTTEVQVRYENSEFAPSSAPQLTDLDHVASHSGDVEQKALNEMGAYVAARVSEQTVSMVAQDIGSGVKSFLDVDPGGTPVLRLKLDRARAWATIGQALSRAKIEVRDSDEQKGVYQISLRSDLNVERGKRGFFGRLLTFGGDGLKNIQLDMKPAQGDGFAVAALNGEGKPLDREFAQDVLVLIREYAS